MMDRFRTGACDQSYRSNRDHSGVTVQTGSILLHDRAKHVRRGLRLEYATIAYNILEGLIAIISGLFAGSIALVGFGVDSVIEVTSGLGLVWRLHSDGKPAERERAERLSLRIVGVCFIALATYVAVDALASLVRSEAPDESIPGIVLATASLIIMPLLARAKRRVAARIGSAALTADARQTQLCTYLSAILLGGLLLNAVFGWWWADPVAALIMAPIIAKEGVDALRGRICCACEPLS
jgi:divalent metal cation (Fe/Co/Zn/Cd) transporter